MVLGQGVTMERCGKCKQFTRTKENERDLCSAWYQPTSADRQACEFFSAKHAEKPQTTAD